IYHNENGEVSGAILLGADVSERIATQQRLQQTKEMAEQLQADQRQLLSMVSHEFRAPLAVIDSAAQLLQLRCAPECGSAEVIERVRRGVKRLSALIENCLAEDRLKRIETEGLQRMDDAIDLPAFLASALDEASQGSPQHALQLDCAADMGSCRGDAQLLLIVLHNLLGNACKYSPVGSTVHLRARKEASGELVLAIEDAGAGIAPDELDKVCQRYFRGTNRGQSSGAGLGLFLVERIVELHRGKLQIDSKVGAGTTVTVRLPPSAANR
ncbi:MAG: HAMP domain-containing sensor histidine kinase, partial [Rhodocyclaceae bacterium]